MKKYTEQEDGGFYDSTNKTSYPPRYKGKIHKEVARGEAEIIPYVKSQEDIVVRIKGTANRKILKIAKEDQQRNMLANAISVLDADITKLLAVAGLTSDNEAEKVEFRETWGRIKAIRDHSNVLEENPENENGWPE